MPDRELEGTVERAREHDPDAWEALYRRAYPRLFAYARRRVSSDERADDAVSEAVTRAMGAIDRFRPSGAGFDGWLFGILKNVLLEHHRRRQRVSPGVAPESSGPVSADPGPLDRVLASERDAEVRDAFGRLSDEDQELLELRVVAELDAKQVALALGRRPGAVRMGQSRALTRLRALLWKSG